MTSKKTMKSAFESMMFVWGEPLSARTAGEVFNMDAKEAYDLFLELKEEYEQEGRGIRIREINKSFQFVSDEENADYIRRLCTPVKPRRLTQSALEVLAIVAYKQPVTRGEIESIRGIKCDRVLESLAKRDLVTEAGRSTGIGRPILYGTTDAFLKYFGFATLRDLPEIQDIQSAIEGDVPEDSVDLQQIALEFPEMGKE